MSDYTPTTEEVAEIYFQSGYKTTPEQFYRWLAEHDREVKADVYDEALQDAEVSPMLRNPYREETE